MFGFRENIFGKIRKKVLNIDVFGEDGGFLYRLILKINCTCYMFIKMY